MIHSKKIYITAMMAVAVLLFNACKNAPHDEVFSTYDNGQPKLVFTVVDKKDGKKERLAEKFYYENGQPMYEKHFKDNKPTGTWKFFYNNGQLHAQGSFDGNDSIGSDWKFYDTKGNDYYGKSYDSLIVLDFTADHRPLSVAYCSGDEQMRFQFNDDYSLNARGLVRNGMKEGRWEFFYANGQLRMEAVYNGGVENGAYNSFRENGIPFFRGFYINGKRANIWEFYDEAGNLVGRQDFDTH